MNDFGLLAAFTVGLLGSSHIYGCRMVDIFRQCIHLTVSRCSKTSLDVQCSLWIYCPDSYSIYFGYW